MRTFRCGTERQLSVRTSEAFPAQSNDTHTFFRVTLLMMKSDLGGQYNLCMHYIQNGDVLPEESVEKISAQ